MPYKIKSDNSSNRHEDKMSGMDNRCENIKNKIRKGVQQ
jgi:hypothetical protein